MSSNSSTLADAWLRLWSPTINLPGSGSIGGFNYHPYTTWEAPSLFRGNPVVEQGVYREVASPGKQLGAITDAVLALAEALAKNGTDLSNAEPIKKLRELDDEIKTVKSRLESSATKQAETMLDELQKSDPAALQILLQKYI